MGEKGSDVTRIIDISGKLVVFVLAGSVALFLIPIFNINPKLKVISAIVMLLLFGVIGYVLFKDQLIVKENDYSSLDELVIPLINDRRAEVVENKLLPEKHFSAGKEYIIKERVFEDSITILALDGSRRIRTNDEIAGQAVYAYDAGPWRWIEWASDDFEFRIAAEGNHADQIAVDLIKSSIRLNPPGARPNITIIWPPKMLITNKNRLSFRITDKDSNIDKTTIRVIGTPGFDPMKCRGPLKNLTCEFTAELEQGPLNMTVSARDTENHKSSAFGTFIFDSTPWQIELIYPQSDYTNKQALEFRIVDDGGVNRDLLEIDIPATGSCRPEGTSLRCKYLLNITEGEQAFHIKGKDMAGNENEKTIRYVYDMTAPEIVQADFGFIIKDISGLSSLTVDRKRIDISECKERGIEYLCVYNREYRTVSAEDKAGNSATIEFVNDRE
jgi:hypothetical protein